VDVELSCRYPRTCVPETVSRPCGTGLAPNLYPALRAGLSSTVPFGTGSNIPLVCRLSHTRSPGAVRENQSGQDCFSDQMKRDNGGSEYGNCRGNLEPANTAGDKFSG
jgi:hypothetical protein